MNQQGLARLDEIWVGDHHPYGIPSRVSSKILVHTRVDKRSAGISILVLALGFGETWSSIVGSPDFTVRD